MYKNYYVNKSDTGNPNYNHEVHTQDCQWLPSIQNREYLGCLNTCSDAIENARKIYLKVDGCATCCSDCHKA